MPDQQVRPRSFPKQLKIQTHGLTKPAKDGNANMKKPGLYANIQAKRKRIKAGSGEKMRKPGAKGAPTKAAFKAAAKTARKRK